jgi:uncharacterized glyoxalase superfamily protein PhnB
MLEADTVLTSSVTLRATPEGDAASVDGPLITQSITASVPYDDPRGGIRWLTEVLGFRPAAIHDGPAGDVVHAELTWEGGFLFVGRRAPAGEPWHAVGISSIALNTHDPEAVDRYYERALASGADIIRPLHDAPFGSHQFDVRDPEGNLWTVGTYQPQISLRGG